MRRLISSLLSKLFRLTCYRFPAISWKIYALAERVAGNV